jgi:ABC-type glycerol-3-phosphate transport system substrate-binding protein
MVSMMQPLFGRRSWVITLLWMTGMFTVGAATSQKLRDLEKSANEDNVIRILTIDMPGMDLMGMNQSANDYFQKTGIKVVYEGIAGVFEAHEEIRSQAQYHLPLYDGYICNPFIVGGAAQYDGWMDLTETVRTRADLEWQDILPTIRENLAVYDNKVYMLPLDGDAHFLFYREDVLKAFNVSVPRTWDEYWQVAQAVHGKEFEGRTLSGSCVGRKAGAHNNYWANLVISSYTQTRGPSQGHLFDPNDMEPLTGEAMVEALKMLELQATYGHPLGKQVAQRIDGHQYPSVILTYSSFHFISFPSLVS